MAATLLSGCPNGCSRPYLAEIALVGRAPERYNLMLGGDRRGQRFNTLAERLKLNLKVYRPLVSRAWMEARHSRLWEQGMVGYVSIGDFHTTCRWEPGMREEGTRLFGMKRECGIHEDIQRRQWTTIGLPALAVRRSSC